MILGKSHNVAITKSIYEYLCSTVERLAASGVKAEKRNYREYLAQIAGTGIEAYSPPNWRTWKSSFILGCSRRLCDRLKAQKRAYESNGIPTEPGQGNFVCALACRQAYEREAAAIEKWKIENNIRTRSRKYRLKTQVTGDGYMAGQRAGDEIGLNRQVKSGEGQMLSLKKTTA